MEAVQIEVHGTPAMPQANILLVDDRPENLIALESVLAGLGENLVKASSGREALKHLLEQDFAVILLDVQMPEMDGFEAATIIRSRERTRHTPILFLTAINKSDIHVSRGYSVGAVDYVFKPFLPEVLKAKVAAFVDLYKKTAALEAEVIQRKEAEEKLDASNSLLESISRSVMGFIEGGNPSATFLHLLGKILNLTHSEYGFIGEILETNEGDPYLKTFAIASTSVKNGVRPAEAQGSPALLELYNLKGLCKTLKEKNQAFIANEAGKIPRHRALPPGHPPLLTFLALPFYKGGNLVGMVGLANRPDGYDERLVGYLEPFLHTCAIIIDAYRNEQRRRQAEEEVRKLNDDLERRVAERTAELHAINAELENEIAEREKAEKERAQLLALEQRARAEAESARERLGFLNEASSILAGSLDYQATLERVAWLAVPYLADFCIIDMLDEEEQLCRVAIAHSDSSKDELLNELRSLSPGGWTASSPILRVLETGQPQLDSEVTIPANDVNGSQDPFRLIAELEVRSHMAVPLVARGAVFGVMSLGAADTARRYSQEDLALAEELAHRAAAAIDNARLVSELQEAARRKDEFLATLAHELRNPLAAISNADYILEEMGTVDSRAARLRTIISRQARHLSILVDDLLEISRINSGKIALKKEPVALKSVIQRAVEANESLIAGREHQLTVTIPEEPVWLEADTTRLEQVFSNLLNNAAKYTEPGGHIWFTAVSEGAEAVVSIRDNGVGIAPELLGRVFDLFAQAEQSLDRSQGGLGIGLALVRKLIQMHGGSVTALSQGSGQGSEFIVRLPALPAEYQPAQEKAPAGVQENDGPMQILVVEDNVDAAETLTEILELWGHNVRLAHDGPQALESARNFRPEIVLLDIGLPGMDGHEVARRLRKQLGPDVVLIALTGYGQKEDRRLSAQAGFNLHLTKPVDPAQLRRLLTTRTEAPEPVSVG